MIAKNTDCGKIPISSAVDRDKSLIGRVAAAARCVSDPTRIDGFAFDDADNPRSAFRAIFVRSAFAFVVVVEAARTMT
jgi:hypothetical protein